MRVFFFALLYAPCSLLYALLLLARASIASTIFV